MAWKGAVFTHSDSVIRISFPFKHKQNACVAGKRQAVAVARRTGAGLAAHLVRQGVKLPDARIEREVARQRPFENEMEIDRVESRTIMRVARRLAEAPTVPSFRAEVEIEMRLNGKWPGNRILLAEADAIRRGAAGMRDDPSKAIGVKPRSSQGLGANPLVKRIRSVRIVHRGVLEFDKRVQRPSVRKRVFIPVSKLGVDLVEMATAFVVVARRKFGCRPDAECRSPEILRMPSDGRIDNPAGRSVTMRPSIVWPVSTSVRTEPRTPSSASASGGIVQTSAMHKSTALRQLCFSVSDIRAHIILHCISKRTIFNRKCVIFLGKHGGPRLDFLHMV